MVYQLMIDLGHYITEAVAETGCLVAVDIMVCHELELLNVKGCILSRPICRRSTHHFLIRYRSIRLLLSGVHWLERLWGRRYCEVVKEVVTS
jgi:hypothetical protein